jgi:hypothetical protein
MDELAYGVDLDSDAPGLTCGQRAAALLETVRHFIECHGWALLWDSRGIRLTHDTHSLVLAVPPIFAEYVADASTLSAVDDPRSPASADGT